MYYVTKTYGHELGLSACFRQHRAESHCRFLHGYALSFAIAFHAQKLDKNGWVIDFGSLKPIKEHLVEMFDHKLLVAEDDPMLDTFRWLDEHNAADVIALPRVGCEAFAAYVFDFVHNWIKIKGDPDLWQRGVKVISVECREHGANAATFML